MDGLYSKRDLRLGLLEGLMKVPPLKTPGKVSLKWSFPRCFFAFLLFPRLGFWVWVFFAPSLITIPTYADVINFVQPVLSPLLDTLSLLVSKLPW